jgi:hypothetical protein
MILFLTALLLPLYFTAPADTVRGVGANRAHVTLAPVRSYRFHRLDDRGTMVAIPGYADSAGTTLLLPHSPGTRETVWLSPGATGRDVTIYVLSQDFQGNLSPPSNGCLLRGISLAGPLDSRLENTTTFDLSIARQAHARSEQASQEMVLRYYGLALEPHPDAYVGYESVLRGSRTTELNVAARRSRHEVVGTTLPPGALFFRRWTP